MIKRTEATPAKGDWLKGSRTQGTQEGAQSRTGPYGESERRPMRQRAGRATGLSLEGCAGLRPDINAKYMGSFQDILVTGTISCPSSRTKTKLDLSTEGIAVCCCQARSCDPLAREINNSLQDFHKGDYPFSSVKDCSGRKETMESIYLSWNYR